MVCSSRQVKLEDFIRWKAKITYLAYLHFGTSTYLINGGQFFKSLTADVFYNPESLRHVCSAYRCVILVL